MHTADLDYSDTFISPLKRRNSTLDNFFYDVGALTPAEMAELSPLLDREGSIIVVSPRQAHRPIRHYKTGLRFMLTEGHSISAIAVAGVGSSVIGTAALARNIADSLNVEVAGLVTGYGMADLISEAMGGWFFYGALDFSRLELKRLIEQAKDTLPESSTGNSTKHSLNHEHSRDCLPGNQDTGTLLDLLMAKPKNLKLLVGHSKGSLLIDYVLETFIEDCGHDDHPYFDELSIVTLGAVAAFPDQFTRKYQFIGELDWFGGINSRSGIPHHKIEGAWHHLNRCIPFHLSVDKALKTIGSLN